MTETARIYGDSLYDLAVEEGLAQTILEQLQGVQEIFRENKDYLRLLAEPSVPMKERLGLLDEAFAGKLETYFLNFLKILCERGMLGEFGGCAEEFRTRFYKDQGIAPAVVYSAVALTEKQLQTLKQKLEERSGKKVLLEQKIRPALIGGMKIEIEGVMIDGSISGRLSEMHKKLREINM